ncbi:TPA: hypothetical protein SLG99_004388 [Serratia marcescens]|nr:hypothetical protein [Serratia marcescens]HEI8821976.1 hypothetical protein [Serratia marcescens]
MNKLIIWLSILIIISACLFLLPLSSHSWKPFRCNTQVSASIAKKKGDEIELNVNINVIAFHKEQSEVLVVGSLKNKNENYTVFRRIFITHKPANINDYSTTVVTSERRHPTDNVPDTLWQHYVLSEIPGVALYVETKHLRGNLLLYKGLDNPIFICTITKQ